jgi:hypothetical protein
MPLSEWKEDELWEAVSNRDAATVKKLLAKGANASSIAPDGWVRDEASGKGGKSVLHHAAYVGDLGKCICFLFIRMHVACPHRSPVDARTAVFIELVEQGGADMNKRRQRNWATFRGNTPFRKKFRSCRLFLFDMAQALHMM